MNAPTVARALGVSTALALVLPLVLSASASAQGYGYSPPPNPSGYYGWDQSTSGPPQRGAYGYGGAPYAEPYDGGPYGNQAHANQPYAAEAYGAPPPPPAYPYPRDYGFAPYAGEQPYADQAHANQPYGAQAYGPPPPAYRAGPGYRGDAYAEGPYDRQSHLNQPSEAGAQPIFNYLRPPAGNRRMTQGYGSSYAPRGGYGRGRFVVAIGALNLRAGPSDAAPIETSLPGGTPVTLAGGGNGGWWRVRTPYGMGWVYSRYLAPA